MNAFPLPNSISCPALDLFRKYNYPDEHTVQQFSDSVTQEVLKKLSAENPNERDRVARPTQPKTGGHQ